MIGIYFSGSGNTKYAVTRFINEIQDDKNSTDIASIEDNDVIQKIKENDEIIFAYPIYYSNLNKIVRDFINENKSLWNNKKIFIICTMGLFSGDGSGVSARLFKKYGAQILGGLHLNMPDSVADVKALKRKDKENIQIIKKSIQKITLSAQRLKDGNPTKEGLGFFYHLAGLFGQRLWFFNKTRNYTDKIKIDYDKCINCQKCTRSCPMHNLNVIDGQVKSSGKCVMCYRCVNNCPSKAITIIGKNVILQNNIGKYIKKIDS